jgi:hypothetical protein
MVDYSPNGSDPLAVLGPNWWLHRLTGCLARDQARMVLMDRYYRGDHPLPFVPRKLKSEFLAMLHRSKSNFMRIVVDAPAERLRLQGFRARDEEKADEDIWSWWLDNHMNVDSNIAITDAIKMARSYISVWRYDGDTDATVQVEDPRGTYVEYDPLRRHRRVAGLRVWNDEWTGKIRADVWLEDGCYQFLGEKNTFRASRLWPPAWQPGDLIDDGDVRYIDTVSREDPAPDLSQWCAQWTELGVITNPWKEIPLVPLVNRQSTSGRDGESEIDDVYATQDRINAGLFNRDLAGWTTAYRQKWATGLEIPEDPESGEAVEPFQAAIDRLWTSEDPATRFGSFEATAPGQFIDPVEQDIKHIAVQTRTPRHYLVESGQTPSGDSIKSAESGLVAKVEDKQPYLGASFCEVVRLRNKMTGRPEAPVEAIWSDPEFRTLAELTDATIKQHAAQLIPRRVAQEKLGYSPSEIDRMDALFAQEDLVADAVAATEEEVPEDQAAAEEELSEDLQVPVG